MKFPPPPPPSQPRWLNPGGYFGSAKTAWEVEREYNELGAGIKAWCRRAWLAFRFGDIHVWTAKERAAIEAHFAENKIVGAIPSMRFKILASNADFIVVLEEEGKLARVLDRADDHQKVIEIIVAHLGHQVDFDSGGDYLCGLLGAKNIRSVVE